MMVTIFIYNCNGDWVEWCRVPLRNLVTLREIAARSGVECDWLGW